MQNSNGYWATDANGTRYWQPLITASLQYRSVAPAPPSVTYQAATPLSSPATAYTTPVQALSHLIPGGSHGATRTPQPRALPPKIAVTEPAFVLSARMVLDMAIPAWSFSGGATGHISSPANVHYANIGPIDEYQMPQDLSGYEQLPTDLLYHTVQEDPTLAPAVEADAIKAVYNLVFAPVNRVLFNTSYYLTDGTYCKIRSVSEDTHTIKVALDPQNPDSTVSHVSRVDYSWEVELGVNNWKKFMIMELKRPGVLKMDDWTNAFNGQGIVTGSGGKCCRQMVKYAYCLDVPFVGVSDGRSMVILELDRQGRNTWLNNYGGAQTIRARGSWVQYDNLKRSLYIFMKYALRCYLERSGKAINQ